MAAHYASESDDEFHSIHMLPERSDDDGYNDRDEHELHDSDDEEEAVMSPPVHPIVAFQAAFEESIVESTDQNHNDSTSTLDQDAEMRRRRLLEAQRYEDVRKTRWKQKPDAKHHPFLKLMAQIVFGMHLLQQEQAKSNEEVVKILQNHVNEVDSFLERTSEDFDLALKDIEERIRYLKLPMQHMDVFEQMLDERQFRSDLLNGNEKIEKIIGRTAKAMKDAVFDITSGIESTKELGVYLNTVESKWPVDNIEIADVLGAMRGNEQGWLKYLNDLLTKGKNLNNDLVTLGNVIAEINRLAGAASRRNKPQGRTDSPVTQVSGNSSPGVRSKFAKDTVVYKKPGPWLDKPLPQEPDASAGAVRLTMSKPHPVPFETRFEQPRRRAPAPGSRNRSSSRHRPRTAGHGAGPREAQAVPKEDVKELVSFLRHSGPLRSNPPDAVKDNWRPSTKKPGRSQSQSAGEMLKMTAPRSPPKQVRRAQSQGDLAVAKTPTKSIRRKPVGSVTSKSQTQLKKLPPIGQEEEEIPSITNGFSRRISRRLRNLPPPVKNTPRKDPVARPVDSVYSSTPEKERKRSTSSPTTDTDKELPPEPEKDAAGHVTPPGSRLGLFPKETGPLTPSQASERSRDFATPNSKAWEASTGTDNSPRPTHSSKASRTFSIRRFFSHRKNESQSVAV